MSLNTLETAYVNGQIIDASHVNELTLSLLGQFVGRDANGVPTPAQSLGTLAIPWGNLYANGIILNGLALDVSQVTAAANRVVSGATRSLSSLADFLRPDGAALEFDILGATTDLVLSVNNVAVSITTDITKTGVVAAPAANNTALVNDTTMSNDLYAGEIGEAIPEIIIDTVGSEISSLVGEIVAMKTPTGEIFQGLLKSATLITNVFRGFYFNSAGSPIVRGNLSNNDVLTLMKIGWVFIEDNGTTIDVSNLTPVVSFESPSSPATGQYWFDISNQVWKRYSGVSFEVIDRILVGQVVSDATNAIATRSSDFSNSFRELNNVEVFVDSTEIVNSIEKSNRISVYGTELDIDLTGVSWNITTDLESPLTEAASTMYYLYLSDKGERIISDEKPYYRADLKGYYHPYHSYRCSASIYNDASSDIIGAQVDRYNPSKHDGALIRLEGGNGFGSTATSIRRFTTLVENSGIEFDYIDSATQGASVTIRETAEYLIEYSDSANAVGQGMGVSKNSSNLTVAVSGLAASEQIFENLAKVSSPAYPERITARLKLNKGDILRVQANAGVVATSNIVVTLQISKVNN